MDDLSGEVCDAAQQVKYIREVQGIHQGDVYLSRLPPNIQAATLEILANDPEEVEGAVRIGEGMFVRFSRLLFFIV